MNKPIYCKQNCDFTLNEGLQEYYSSNPPEVKEFSDRFGLLLINHDITHVIFGLGTTIQEEALLDTWTLRGTNITWKQIYQYATDSKLKELTKIIIKDNGGWKHIIGVIIRCIPLKLKIHFNRIPKMKKKWPFSNVSSDMMNRSINDLRREYGINILQINS